MKRHTTRRGQAIIESIVAISVLIMGFMGMFSLLNQSLGLSRVISDNYTGTYLASEGIEIVRNMLDANTIREASPWNSGVGAGEWELDWTSGSLAGNGSRTLAFNPNERTYSYSGSVATPFRRKIRITQISANQIKVESIVDWTTRGGGAFTIVLEDHFFNWRP